MTSPIKDPQVFKNGRRNFRRLDNKHHFPLGKLLKASGAIFEMRWLCECFAAANGPIRDPVEHFFERDARRTEMLTRLLRIAEKRVRRFGAFELDGLLEASGKFLGHFADAQEFRAGDVDYERRRGGERERLQAHGVGVALPDGVEIAHGKRNWLAGEDALGDIDEDAVTKFGGVIETDDGNGERESAAKMFEHALAAEAAHGVFTDRIERIGFGGAGLRDGRKAVDISG